MPTYRIRHVTTYRYAAPVTFGEHRLMLRPRESHDQQTRSAWIDIVPPPAATVWSEDPSGNLVGRASFAGRDAELRVAAELEVQQAVIDLDAIRLQRHSLTCPFSYGAEEMAELARFIERQHPDPEHVLDRWAWSILGEDPERDTLAFLRRLTARIRGDFSYRRRLQKGIQDPLRTLRLGTGSCRDFAVLMAEAVRAVGLAARFASGYLYMAEPEPEEAGMGGHTHAWLQVYLPGAGWVDFDPTSGSVGNANLVRVALVRDPDHAAPLSGSFFGQPGDFLEMTVSVCVTRVDQSEAGFEPDLAQAQAA